MNHDLSPAPVQLMQMLFGFAVSRAISVLAELRVADHLKGRPMTAEDIALRVPAHPRSLYRVLRASASAGIFSEDEEHRFSLTPLAEPLLTDIPGSLRDFAVMITADWQFQTWAELPYSVRTGKPAFDKVHGMSSFEYFWTNQAAGKVFNDAMTSNSAFTSAAVVDSYDFTSIQNLVDVGGGHGLLLASILAKNPHMKGVLYDTPTVISEAQSLINEHRIADRCQTAGGDFFKSVPEGADAYIMKHIIHDWDDDRCVTILNNCRQAMKEGGKILIIEMIVPPGNQPSPAKLLDLQMLLFLPGCERTEAEYRDILNKAGFELTGIIPTATPFSIIEGKSV